MKLIIELEVEPKEGWTYKGGYIVQPDIDPEYESRELYNSGYLVSELGAFLIDETNNNPDFNFKVVSCEKI